MTQIRTIWVIREVYRCDWNDWDAWTRVCSDMTETPKKFVFDSTHLKQNILRRLSHISLSHISLSGTPRVSLISVTIWLVWSSHIRHPPIHFLFKNIWKKYHSNVCKFVICDPKTLGFLPKVKIDYIVSRLYGYYPC